MKEGGGMVNPVPMRSISGSQKRKCAQSVSTMIFPLRTPDTGMTDIQSAYPTLCIIPIQSGRLWKTADSDPIGEKHLLPKP